MAKYPLITIQQFPQIKTFCHFYCMQNMTPIQESQKRCLHLASNLKCILWIEKPWSVALRSVALQFVRQLSHAYMEPHELSFLAKMELFL